MNREQKIEQIQFESDYLLKDLEVATEELILEIQDYSIARNDTVKQLDESYKQVKSLGKELNKLAKQYRKLITQED